ELGSTKTVADDPNLPIRSIPPKLVGGEQQHPDVLDRIQTRHAHDDRLAACRLASAGLVVLRFVGLASIEMSQIDAVAHEVNLGLGGEIVKPCVLQLVGVLIEQMIRES